MNPKINAYSRQWFDFFHIDIDESRTGREIAFICACAPLPDFRNVADICCGMGRLARALSNTGYAVTGVDRHPDAVANARKLGGGPIYVEADVRDYRPESGAFDLVIIMGQSFGYFDVVTNRAVLGQLAAGLRQGGRVIVDLWNPNFFRTRQGKRYLKTTAGEVMENKQVRGNRLLVELQYPDGGRDQFEWQLFSPNEMMRLAESLDLTMLASCSDYDCASIVSGGKPRTQFLLERGGRLQ
jgi:Predicted RNA methylase